MNSDRPKYIGGECLVDSDVLDLVLAERWDLVPSHLSRAELRAIARKEVHRLRNEATKAILTAGLTDRLKARVEALESALKAIHRESDSLATVEACADALGWAREHKAIGREEPDPGNVLVLGCPNCDGGKAIVREEELPGAEGESVSAPCERCGATWTLYYQGDAVQMKPPSAPRCSSVIVADDPEEHAIVSPEERARVREYFEAWSKEVSKGGFTPFPSPALPGEERCPCRWVRPGALVWYYPALDQGTRFAGVVAGEPFLLGDTWCVTLRDMEPGYSEWRNGRPTTRITAAAVDNLAGRDQ